MFKYIKTKFSINTSDYIYIMGHTVFVFVTLDIFQQVFYLVYVKSNVFKGHLFNKYISLRSNLVK